MNIFVLDEDPVTCAQYHCDSHVVKMVLETAQLLSTAHRVLDGDCQVSTRNGRKYVDYVLENNNDIIYRATHLNHPCASWVRHNINNYLWSYDLFRALSEEFSLRFGSTHLSWSKLSSALSELPLGIDRSYAQRTQWVLAMPEKYHHKNAVMSYRDYYRGEKAHLFKWTNRSTPHWIH